MARLNNNYRLGALKRSVGPRWENFIEHLGKRQNKPQRGHVREFSLGILKTASLCVARIADAVGRSDRLGIDEHRLCNALKSPKLDDDFLRMDYLSLLEPHLRATKDLALVIDETDIQKPWARRKQRPKDRRLPYLGGNWDGSTPPSFAEEKRKDPQRGMSHTGEQGWGWTVMGIRTAAPNGAGIPMALELYSPGDPAYRSKSRVLKDCLRQITPYVPEDTLVVGDRGFDGDSYIKALEACGRDFVVRLSVDKINSRRLWVPGKGWLQVHEFADRFSEWERWAPYRWREHKDRTGFRRAVHLQPRMSGGKRSSQPSEQTYSIVLCGSDSAGQPIVLLTSRLIRTKADARRLAENYTRRWCIEEDYRWLKNKRDGLNLERDLMVTNWNALRRLVRFGLYAYGFLALLNATQRELCSRITELRKDLKKVPHFLFYRLLATIWRVLPMMPGGP